MIALATLLSGCAAVGQNYVRSELGAPVQWTESLEQAEPAPRLEEAAWWQMYGDPVLNGLIEQAVKNNLDLEQARARIVQAHADLVVAGAGGLPTVSSSGSVTRSRSSEDTTAATSPTTVYQAGFDASWEIDVFGGIRRGVGIPRPGKPSRRGGRAAGKNLM
jgi:outer membrane protein TolC